MFGGFPLTGFSLHWYATLFDNEQVLNALLSSQPINALHEYAKTFLDKNDVLHGAAVAVISVQRY